MFPTGEAQGRLLHVLRDLAASLPPALAKKAEHDGMLNRIRTLEKQINNIASPGHFSEFLSPEEAEYLQGKVNR
ncbi:MAG: hypothetical protein ACR2PY_06500 [Salinispira sp.]